MNERRRFSAEQKILILREFLENHMSISTLCEKHKIHPNEIYRWKKQLFEGASAVFSQKGKHTKSLHERKIEQMENELQNKDQVISELASENIQLKKNFNGRL